MNQSVVRAKNGEYPSGDKHHNQSRQTTEISHLNKLAKGPAQVNGIFFSLICFQWTQKPNIQVITDAVNNAYMSHVMRKPDFCLCENKGADCTADQRLCFRYSDSK